MAIRYPVKLGRRSPNTSRVPSKLPRRPPIPLVYPANLAGTPWYLGRCPPQYLSCTRQTWPAPLGALPSFLPSREEKKVEVRGQSPPKSLTRTPTAWLPPQYLIMYPANLAGAPWRLAFFSSIKGRKEGNDTESTTDPILATPRPAQQNAPHHINPPSHPLAKSPTQLYIWRIKHNKLRRKEYNELPEI